MPGEILELTIEKLVYPGRSLARHNGRAVFLDYGLPGELVKAEILRRRKGFLEGRLLEVLTPSADRIPPRCSHFGTCGGCVYQDFNYEKQIQEKEKLVRESLQKLGGFPNPPVEPIIPSPDTFFYRNKMEFSFADQNGKLVLGLHERGHFEKMFNVESCFLQSELSNQIVAFCRDFFTRSGLPGYNWHTHEGFLRFLVIREGKNTDEVMVALVTAKGEADLKAWAQELVRSFPQITSVLHLINPTKAQIATGEEEIVLWGKPFIKEKIGKFNFFLSAKTFLQTNSRQTEKPYQTALEVCVLSGKESVLDLYCGAGTISIFVSPYAKEVEGVEIVPEAIEMAEKNKKENGVENVRFVLGEARKIAKQYRLDSRKFDRIIVDPPRAGLHPKVIRDVLPLGAEKITYVSCNPTTFARDAKLFAEGGYRLKRVIPVDMYPHTFHVELVSSLEKA
ncbi:MAG TPA: 23S rRNA (uracil(1939)-C(5))-methyltransferase RlmD [Verrucomicrobiae bacterium]|nr:23S rRNA (uracil(1939)-C(5))-methyltransferase RlmD [Verrucomicrobiae bacterium]